MGFKHLLYVSITESSFLFCFTLMYFRFLGLAEHLQYDLLKFGIRRRLPRGYGNIRTLNEI